MPRFRRASDVVVLVPGVLLLLGLIVAYPPSRLERSFAAFLAAVPGWLDPVWGFAYDLLALWAIVLFGVGVVARRHMIIVQVLGSIAGAALLSAVCGRLATGHWRNLEGFLGLEVNNGAFPVARVALATATILAVVPHLVRPLGRLSRWVLTFGALGALFVEHSPPTATFAGLLVGIVAASAIRLAFGTSAGRPETPVVVASLAELGIEVRVLEAAARQPAGVFIARGEDSAGRSLLVKVYGRDAYDMQLLEKMRRTAWYRGKGTRLRLSRLEAVEQEALLTLLAEQAGVTTSQVVTLGESSSGDALLVVRDDCRALRQLAAWEITDELLRQVWEAIEVLGAAGIAHQHIDTTSLVIRDGVAGLVDFQAGALRATLDQLLIDRTQLLAATAALVGAQRAIATALGAVGDENLAALLPFLQSAALPPALQDELATAGIDADQLRQEAASAVGVEMPPLVQLQRVTWRTLVQSLLLVLAAATILKAVVGLDLGEIGSYLEDASWWWVAVAFLVAQLPRLSQAAATLGSVTATLPYGPTYIMQLAGGYMSVALPSHLARLGLGIRFLQRLGVPLAAAVASSAIDSFATTAVQLGLLTLLLLFSESTLSLDLDLPSGGNSMRLLLVLACLVAIAVLVVFLVRRIRKAIVDRVRRWWPDIRVALHGLRQSHKLALLLGGNLATELLLATALGMFARALGYHVGLTDLLVINISTSVLAAFVPVPGGIGVIEFGLTAGLTAAGMPDEAALTAALLYRAATFYLPPLWGFVAFRWLQRNAYL
jgi:uncharacterized membrane protein YbhN (UPF0104 family)/tRNA A-37 threonylcarbamoyl transferase component Bud32